jgi:hypothetical protein
MYNASIEPGDELIEERLLQALSWNDMLPYQELKMYSAVNAPDRLVRRALSGLIERGLVRRQAGRKGLWYLGYAQLLNDASEIRLLEPGKHQERYIDKGSGDTLILELPVLKLNVVVPMIELFLK